MSSGLEGLKNNPMTKDLIVSDADYLSSQDYRSVGDGLEKCLDAYVNLLRRLAENSSGNLAENLQSFAGIVQSYMGGTIEAIMAGCANMMEDYVRQIDAADSTLY